MGRHRSGPVRLAALAVLAGLALAGCGGGDIESAPTGGGGGEECGEFDIAINPWVGYEASAHVVGYVASSRLGCDVEYKNVKEEVAWQGMGNDEIDVVIENWGHDDLKKKYIEDQGIAQEAGSTGNVGIIGWYVPPWMAEEYPDITDWKNLNKYADMFQTSESGDKGQLLDGDPSFVTNDEALVKNLDLNYEVVYAGSEAALIQAFRQAEANKEPLIGYFYEPQWFMAEVPLVKVDLPPYKPGCDADPEKVACDYPEYDLDKIVATDFAKSGSPAYDLVKNFQWTNDDQNVVAKYIAADGMDPEEAAEKWVEANQDKVDAWLK
ncbi:ABC transporter substrate-binding protein [Nocardioides sp. WL0053]|uniref:ABC transporter substrate-binding protein n=1 Tax=Nocardioides jiangsuensis TaxID=2866161 RepID=A0ABS7RLL2_9ACTN|nr:ABC transporter substrate-binding protein [Nocardioides jiangsuensis]MBY9075354.1 ABC transporter substrate-binding protein [Nocardioides jiangsuensis]